MAGIAGKAYRRGRLNTVDLLMLTCSDQLLFIPTKIFIFTNTTYLNVGVNCTLLSLPLQQDFLASEAIGCFRKQMCFEIFHREKVLETLIGQMEKDTRATLTMTTGQVSGNVFIRPCTKLVRFFPEKVFQSISIFVSIGAKKLCRGSHCVYLALALAEAEGCGSAGARVRYLALNVACRLKNTVNGGRRLTRSYDLYVYYDLYVKNPQPQIKNSFCEIEPQINRII